jgi:hypothetical protein
MRLWPNLAAAEQFTHLESKSILLDFGFFIVVEGSEVVKLAAILV